MDTILLNNQVEMPLVGFGVFQITDHSICKQAVLHALKTGYRLIDKTTPRLIQFHTFKNAVNPPFLGGFSIFGTVAAEAEQRSCQRDSLFSMILCNDRKAIVTE